MVRPDLGALTDEALFRGFIHGDYQAFEVLVQRYRRGIYGFLLRSTRDKEAAEDLYQEVFLRVVKKANDFEGKSKFSTWIYKIARNLSIDHARRMTHRRHASLDASRSADPESSTLLDTVHNPLTETDRAAQNREIRRKVTSVVELMPEDQREIFLMRQLQGLSFQQIAEITQVPVNTAKSRMRYALERLREALGSYEDYAKQIGVRE